MQHISSRKSVLVVEDEAQLRKVLSFFLERGGYEVRMVADGQEAISAIREAEPNLIILDLMMRPVSGWEVLHWMKDQQRLPHIAVLIVSALVQSQEQMHGFEEGAIEYVTKPTRPSLIMERVESILSLTEEERAMLRHKRLDDQRKTIEHVNMPQANEFLV